MLNLSIFFIGIMVCIVTVLFIISLLFIVYDSNEVSETAFECGFEPFFLPRIPFSMHFFTVTIVFLIFDLEAVILMPVLFKLSSFLSLASFTSMVWLLLSGLLVEWYDSSVAWQL